MNGGGQGKKARWGRASRADRLDHVGRSRLIAGNSSEINVDVREGVILAALADSLLPTHSPSRTTSLPHHTNFLSKTIPVEPIVTVAFYHRAILTVCYGTLYRDCCSVR